MPSAQAEDARRPFRELARLKAERTAHTNRIGELLVLHDVRLKRIGGQDWTERLEKFKPQLPVHLHAELERESVRLALVREQIARLERAMAEPADERAKRLQQLCALGQLTATGLVVECFGWRKFGNRRELAAASGLVGSPYASGQSAHEQGISKAGNRRLRWLLIEFAWNWLRYQPQSDSLNGSSAALAAAENGCAALASWRWREGCSLRSGATWKMGDPAGAQLKASGS